MGSCLNWGPILGSFFEGCRTILGTQKGTLFLENYANSFQSSTRVLGGVLQGIFMASEGVVKGFTRVAVAVPVAIAAGGGGRGGETVVRLMV